MIRFFISLYIIFCGTINLCLAQGINRAKLDSLFNELSAHNVAMGSIAISKNGNIVYQRAFGNALLRENDFLPVTPETKFRIGSISKMFTSVLIFNAIEEGKLQLNTKVSAFFPQLPNSTTITVKDLLYHRSGLYNYSDDPNFQQWRTGPKTHEELLQLIGGKELLFETGSKASYCNSNFLLLSYILEKIELMPYEEIFRKRIASKIGLVNTYYGKGIDLAKNEAASYKYAERKWKQETATDLSIHSGAGSLVSTPEDLTIFADALFSGKLVTPQSLDLMKTFVEGYGMGMFPFNIDGKKGYGHGGRIDGFASSLQYYPEDEVAIAYCTNGIVYPKDDILDGALRIAFSKPYTIPQFAQAPTGDGGLNRFLGLYSTPDSTIIIKCSSENGMLIAETKGHPFVLKPFASNKFSNLEFGFFFEFENDQLILKEGDNVYHLSRVAVNDTAD